MARYENLFGRNFKLLPPIGTHVIVPDAEHTILLILSLINLVLSTRTFMVESGIWQLYKQVLFGDENDVVAYSQQPELVEMDTPSEQQPEQPQQDEQPSAAEAEVTTEKQKEEEEVVREVKNENPDKILPELREIPLADVVMPCQMNMSGGSLKKQIKRSKQGRKK